MGKCKCSSFFNLSENVKDFEIDTRGCQNLVEPDLAERIVFICYHYRQIVNSFFFNLNTNDFIFFTFQIH